MLTVTPKFQAYWQLMRADRPIGTWLLLWPTLWALWFAAGGIPSIKNLVIFSLGVFLMRSAGCIINDFADRNLDGHVERTRERPLIRGIVSSKEALTLFAALLLVSFLLVLMTNKQTVLLSLVATFLASLYPFMKRYTFLPQAFLGAAFAWAIPMAFTAETGQLPAILWLLYFSTLCWVVAYDTLYAMVDRDDDLKVGIKSSAIMFGRFDKLITATLQIIFLVGLGIVGLYFQRSSIFYIGLALALLLVVKQQYEVRQRDKQACFKAFLDNHYIGMTIFIGLALDYVVYSPVH